MNLRHFWYPVLLSRHLKANKLVKIQLFNEPLVLYRDKNNQAVCLEDRCPHRGTPLSLGRVIKGELECRYHGWRFGNAGSCLKIPTLHSSKTIPARARAFAKECKELYDCIWIMASGINAKNDIADFPHYLFPSFKVDKNSYFLTSWDVEVPYELFIENLLDLSHLPFVHYNTLSNRSNAQPITFKIEESHYADICGHAYYHLFPNKHFKEIYKFISPCIVEYQFINTKRNKITKTQFYCVPFSREHTRVFCYSHIDCSPLILKLINNRLIKNLGKPLARLITNQDAFLLKSQYKNGLLGANLANELVQEDLLVLKYRKWAHDNNINACWFHHYNESL